MLRAGEEPEVERSAAIEGVDPAELEEAGLVYVTDAEPGIRRIKDGEGFRYESAAGRAVNDERVLARIRKLAIPPAYVDVWICPDPRGHLQATGRDARGRKQYRYHPRWRALRDASKFERLAAFGRALPDIRKRCAADLAAPGLSREKVVAAVVKLLETTLIRVGNEEYAAANDSFGLTTLRKRHVGVAGPRIAFEFRAKSGKRQRLGLSNKRIARIVRACRELPGQRLFKYVGEDGETHAVGSADVNQWLRETTGEDFTAKDFRTWAATLLAADILARCAAPDSEAAGKRAVVDCVKQVAGRLANTPAVCRKSYVHPGVLDAFAAGALPALPQHAPDDERTRLGACERRLIEFLERER
jgi:DNA topoisomerase-1